MRPNPGAPRKDFFNKKFYDEQTRVIPKGMNAPRARHIDPSATIINAQIASGASVNTIEPYRPVILTAGHLITPGSDNQHLMINTFPCFSHTDTSTTLNRFNPIWGISIDFITNTVPGRVLIDGASWLNTTGLQTIGGNSIDIFNRKLIQCHGGAGKLVSGSPSGGWAYVNLGSNSMSWLGRTTSSGISLTAAGNVDLYEFDFTGAGIYTLTSIRVGCVTSVSPIVGEVDVEVTVKAGTLHAAEIC